MAVYDCQRVGIVNSQASSYNNLTLQQQDPQHDLCLLSNRKTTLASEDFFPTTVGLLSEVLCHKLMMEMHLAKKREKAKAPCS